MQRRVQSARSVPAAGSERRTDKPPARSERPGGARARTSRTIDYLGGDVPGPGRKRTVAPGVHWLRMPLPFALDHINLWLMEDGPGWTLVDTGVAREEVKELWRGLLHDGLNGRPITRIIVTHHHPDHLGLAGWLHAEVGAPVWMTRTEWLTGTLLHADADARQAGRQVDLFRRNGLAEPLARRLAARGNRYRDLVSPPPPAYRRLADGEHVEIGPHAWRVVVTTGHAPEHACLYCEELGVLIAGDQVLPKITPNVSLPVNEPEADPLALFLGSLADLRALPEGTLVLPSHGRPFRGLHGRIDQISAHHDARLDALLASCDAPRCAAELLTVLFKRELDDHQLMFAMGECLSHLRHLEVKGRLTRLTDAGGIERYG